MADFQNEILMGIDYGEKNIGVSFGRNNLVSPLKVVSSANIQTAIHEIARLAQQNHVTKIVVGLPLTGAGKETQISIKTRKFAKLLKIFTKKPVEFYNEYLSTKESEEAALSQGFSRNKRHSIDHLSAAIILKRYYDENS